MKKGFSLSEVLLGLLLSFFVLDLLLANFKNVTISSNHMSQDLISSWQLHHILNLATDINVSDKQVSFSYFDQDREINLINSKIIIQPGTNIYYLRVEDCCFFVEAGDIFLKINRKSGESIFLIGKL